MSNPVYSTGVTWLPQPPSQIALNDPELGRVGAVEQSNGDYVLVPQAGVQIRIAKVGSTWNYNGQLYGHVRAALWAALNQWKTPQ